MLNYSEHIINQNESAYQALKVLDQLPDSVSRTLFVVNDDHQIVGSLTDGDVRRGLLDQQAISSTVSVFMNPSFRCLYKDDDNVQKIRDFRGSDINLVPLVDRNLKIIDIVNLKKTKTLLPLTALIMAGGRGERLRPYTDHVPKPMLKVGDKPILEYSIDHLISYGISEIYISVKYLKDQIMDHFGDGSKKGIKIHYIEENQPLGTLGALSLVEDITHQDLIVMNSDLLTNIDFEDFYNFYKSEQADMALASIPYVVNIPYAVLQTNKHQVASFTEKPSYTYFSNGGIYLFKTTLKDVLLKGEFFNATDLMNSVIADEKRLLVHYPLLGYWLDIGKHQDYIKAQEDFKHISFN